MKISVTCRNVDKIINIVLDRCMSIHLQVIKMKGSIIVAVLLVLTLQAGKFQ